MGAIASKNASAVASSRRAIAAARASHVRGPAAAPSRPRCPPARPPRPPPSGRRRFPRAALRDRHFVSALQALPRDPRDPRRLGLLLLHPHEAAARAGDRHGAVPHRVVAVGVAQASEEVPSLARAAWRGRARRGSAGRCPLPRAPWRTAPRSPPARAATRDRPPPPYPARSPSAP